jgi:hypothetical protein
MGDPESSTSKRTEKSLPQQVVQNVKAALKPKKKKTPVV